MLHSSLEAEGSELLGPGSARSAERSGRDDGDDDLLSFRTHDPTLFPPGRPRPRPELELLKGELS